MKRRLSVPTGTAPNYQYYETNWQDITSYVLDVSEIVYNVDDVTINEFTQGDFTIILDNSQQKFSPETNSNSLFFGYLTRHKTLITVYAGYIDIATGTEYGYYLGTGYVNAEDIQIDSDGKISIPVLAPTMALDEADASKVNLGTYPGGTTTATTAFRLINSAGGFDVGMVGLTVTNITDNTTATVKAINSASDLSLSADIFTVGEGYVFGQTRWYCNQTVSAMVSNIYNYQRSGAYVLRPYYTALNNTPANNLTLDVYDFSGLTCREALTKLAEVSNSAYWVTPNVLTGMPELNFLTKVPAGASVFTFNSQGASVNILAASNYNEGLKNLYTKVSYSGTNPEISSDESGWNVGDTSASWKYGVKELSIDNPFAQTTSLQQTICTNTLGLTSIPKEEIDLTTKFLPHLKILDPVTVNFYGASFKPNPNYYGKSYYGKAIYSARLGGIQLVNAAMKILRVTHNVMNFTSEFGLRRI